MGRNTNKQSGYHSKTQRTFVMPKRLNSYFGLLIMSYVIVACAAGIYLFLGAQILNIEFNKFIQYPTSIPFLVNVFVSTFLIYVCLMIKAHLQKEQCVHKEDTYLLYCMMVTQVLFFNYLSLIITFLMYLNLRKHNFLSKDSYPNKAEQNKFIPVITESVFYIICFTLIGLTIVFELLLAIALLQK